jgi:hypothetical protein
MVDCGRFETIAITATGADPCHLSGRIVIEPMSLFGAKRT